MRTGEAVQDQEAIAGQSRAALMQAVARLGTDRFAYFSPLARELPWRGGALDVVLMGGQKSSLGHHLDLVGALIAANPGVRLRAVVDEAPGTVALAGRIRSMGADLISIEDFFADARHREGALLVDRYCTWVPGIRYKARLRRLGLEALRFEQFLNAPDLAVPVPHFRAHADAILADFDAYLALESVWDDAFSRTTYYHVLTALATLDFTWFAFSCGSHEDRYLPRDIGLALGGDEVFVDCGAHDGTESLLFARRVANRFRRVHAFEPEPRNYEVVCANLARYAAEHGIDRFRTYPVGAWDANGYLGFSGSDVTVSITGEPVAAGRGLLVARLDDLLDDMSYLKLEIEGAELAALRGAAGLIRAHRPVLAVAAYHRPEDFPALLGWLRELDAGYRLKLRHQSLEPAVLCIYALPRHG